LRNASEQQDDYQRTLQMAKPMLEELSVWHEEFKEYVKDADDSDDLPVSCSNVCRLGYQYIKINIFRAIMRPFLRHQNQGLLPLDAARAKKQARAGARLCTRNAFDFVRSLNQDHIHIFWPQWTRSVYSAVSYFLLLMFITSESYEEALCWIQDLQRMRKELRIKASVYAFLRLGQLRIDSIFWKDLRKVVDLEPQVRKALDEADHTSISQSEPN
jgi:hypothetical protein